jgi:hypothetical protein
MDCKPDYVRYFHECIPCDGVGNRKGLINRAIGGVIGVNGIFFVFFVGCFMAARDNDKNEDALDAINDPAKKRGLKKKETRRSEDAMGRFAGDQVLIARLSNGTVSGSGGITKSDLGVLADRVKVIYGWMQVFSAMTITYGAVPWPEGFKTFSLDLGLAVNLDLMGVLGLFNDCKMILPFLNKFILHMITPLIVIAFVCLARIPAYFLRKTKDRRMAQTELMYKITVTIVLVMYPGICTRIFQVLNCKTIPGHGQNVLNADFGVYCSSDEYQRSKINAWIFMVLYVIGVPVGVWLLLWLHKKHLYDPSQPKHHKVRREFGTLFEQYEPKYWYYECFVLVKKMLLTGAMMVVAPGSTAQLLIAIIIVLFFMLCVFKLAPFEDAVDDWLSFLTSLQLMLTLLVGFALMTDNAENPDYDSSDWGTLDIVLIVINSGAFVALLASILMLHPALRKRCARRMESTPAQAEPLSTSTKVSPAVVQKTADAEKGVGTSPAEDRNWMTTSSS